jgi:nucleoside-diphosphate-sugar epimerase
MIAITGANGLLGSFIIRKLIEAGKPFVALKRAGSDTSLLHDIAGQITWRDADVTDAVSLQEALQDCTQVIHAAAIVSFNPRRKKKIFAVNVDGTSNVVNACLNLGIRRLVHISSVAALGRQKSQQHIDETSKWAESPLNSVYAESKYLAELEVFRAQEEGMSTVIVNPSVILAPADWNKSSAQLFKYVWKERAFYTPGFLSYVDVRDVAEVVVRLADAPIQNERFILNAGVIAYQDFFKQMAQHMHRKPPYIKVSKKVLKIAATFESARAWFANSEPLLTRETARLTGTHFLYDNRKITKALNLEFQTIDQSLRWCCEYYMAKFASKN